MKIGDLVTYEGRSYVLRGLEPMSVPNRRAELEDVATGERIVVPLDEVSPRDHFLRADHRTTGRLGDRGRLAPVRCDRSGHSRRRSDLCRRRRDRGIRDRVRRRGGHRGGDRVEGLGVQAVPRPGDARRVRRRARRRLGAVFPASDFALRQVENLLEELLQSFVRKRSAICALEVLQHPLLPLRVDEADSARFLVALEARDQSQTHVQRVHDGTVRVGDFLAEPADEGIVVHGRPGHLSLTGSSLRGSAISRYGYVTRASTGSPRDGVSSCTTTTTRLPLSWTRTIRSA